MVPVMLGAEINAALGQLRQHAESMMADTCIITIPGASTWDEASKTYATTPVQVYAGPCRVRLPDATPRETDSGDAAWTLMRVIVSVPVDGTSAVPVGALVTITACCLDDVADRTYRVVGTHAQTHSTARRLRCEAVSRG